jgi:hypothetical protein
MLLHLQLLHLRHHQLKQIHLLLLSIYLKLLRHQRLEKIYKQNSKPKKMLLQKEAVAYEERFEGSKEANLDEG